MKKILFVSHEGSISGAPLFLVKLIRYLKVESPDYHIAILFTKQGELVELLTQEGFEVYVFEKRGVLNTRAPAVWHRLIHYFRYLRLLFAFKPDLVYSNTIVNFGEVVLAGLVKIPVLLHMHEGMGFSRKCRYRLKISCFFAKRIIVGSNYVNRVLNYLTGQVGVVIYNGVDVPNDIPVKRRLKGNPLRMGVLGSINPNKGQQVTIESLRILIERGQSGELKIAGKVGDEEYHIQLCDFIKSQSLGEFVQFVGVVPDTEDFLKSIDLLIVPSFDEAFPTVILEAFSMGTLVVASDVGGIPEMIQNDVNGFLFKVGDSMMLADFIEKIILDDSLLQRLTICALNVLKERFDASVSNRLISSHLDEMLIEYD